MAVRKHRDLLVWQKGIELAVASYALTRRFPAEERFGVISQIRRAAVSVPLNIAEGHGRLTPGEFLNQLSSSRGSLNELDTLFVLVRRLGYAPDAAIMELESLLDEESRMLFAFMRQLRGRAQQQRGTKRWSGNG